MSPKVFFVTWHIRILKNLDDLKESKDAVEMELHRSNVALNESDNISVNPTLLFWLRESIII